MTELRATNFARASKRQIAAFIGDSRVASWRRITPAEMSRLGSGIGAHLEGLSRGAILTPIENNLASGGSTPSQMVDSQLPLIDGLKVKPTLAIILTGTNALNAVPGSAASLVQSFVDAWEYLLQRGIEPIQLLDLPRGIASWTDVALSNHCLLNNLLWTVARDHGVAVFDTVSVLSDPATATEEPRAGFYRDIVDDSGIHPVIKGSYACDVEMWQFLRSRVGTEVRRPCSQADVFDATANPKGNMAPSGGLMVGADGTNRGSGASGVVVTGFTNRVVSGTGTSTAMIEARTDGAGGNWQILDLAASSAMVARYSLSSNANGAASGHLVQACVDIELSAASGIDFLTLSLISVDESGAPAFTSSDNKVEFAGGVYGQVPNMVRQFRTLPYGHNGVALALRVEAQVAAGGSGKLRIGGVDLRVA